MKRQRTGTRDSGSGGRQKKQQEAGNGCFLSCPLPKTENRKPRTGFTLVELLVVLLLIGVVAMLLSPMGAEIAHKANTVICANHLHHIGVAWAARNQDRSTPPEAADWPTELYAYVDRSETCYICPEGRGATDYVGPDDGEDPTPPQTHELKFNSNCGPYIPLNMAESMFVWDMTEDNWQIYWTFTNVGMGYAARYEWWLAHNDIPPNPGVVYKVVEDTGCHDNFYDQHIRFEKIGSDRTRLTFKKSPGASYVHYLYDNGVRVRTDLRDTTEPYEFGGEAPGWSEYHTPGLELPSLSYGMNAAATAGMAPKTILALDYMTVVANDGELFTGGEDDEGVALRHCDGGVDKANVLTADGAVGLESPAAIDPAMHPELWGP